MKTLKLFIYAVLPMALITSCTSQLDEVTPDDPTSYTNVLLVERFDTAPILDGSIDQVWENAIPLLNSATVPSAGTRTFPLNSDGTLGTEPVDLFDPYTGESNKISLRGGHDGEYLYLLLEVDDNVDSKDRQSYYFDPSTSTLGNLKPTSAFGAPGPAPDGGLSSTNIFN
jgi:hypothetical protein